MTETPATYRALSPIAERFVLHWGEMGARWGVNRSVAQIHALLYYAGRPMHADAIAETLTVARSNVSNSLRELQNLKLVAAVHVIGDRREFFEATTDPWALCRTIVRERKRREFDPTVATLAALINDPEFAREEPSRQQRLRETHALMDQASRWADDLLTLESSTLSRLMKAGRKVGDLIATARKRTSSL